MSQTLALLQPWIDYVPKQQRRLGLFIFLAFVVHLASFFFIGIDTTRAELRHQPRTHVTVESMTTTSSGGQVDDLWDTLADPRVFLMPRNPVAGLSSDEPAIDFMSIASTIGHQELPSPAVPENFQFAHRVSQPLEQRASEAMIPPRQPFSYEESPPPIATKTTWRWDDDLALRVPAGVPDLPSPISDIDLSPTRLRVAISPSGAVEHVFVEQSCGGGRLDLDQQAVLATRKIRFRATRQTDIFWGQITIFWHYSAKPQEEVVPTPPSGP